MYSFSNLEPVHCPTSSSNCCLLTCIQVSQETGKVVWYSYFFKNFPVCCDPYVPGVSVRNSAHGKGHEEGASAYAKAGWSLRSPPGNSRASTPKTRVCLLYCFVLSPTPLTLRGAVLGVTRVFQFTTVRGMRCSKLSEYRFLWAVKRLIRNCIGEGFFTCWANVCC